MNNTEDVDSTHAIEQDPRQRRIRESLGTILFYIHLQTLGKSDDTFGGHFNASTGVRSFYESECAMCT
jgi:hypothetical protein